MSEIIAITGGSGCLAQHLIRELQQLEIFPQIKEIRAIDKQIFRKFLDYPDNVPVVECIADCAEESEISPLFKDVTLIFHTSARPYNFDMYPNKRAFWRDNVKATEAVITAARSNNVPYLLYTSDSMCGVGNEDSQGLSELAIGDGPKNPILGSYGLTKLQGQRLIRAANGKSLINCEKLFTAIVSPSALYGEGDNWFLPHMNRLCKQYGGTMQRFGDGVSVMSWTYAGNAAYAHLLAARQLRRDAADLGGEAFHVSDQNIPQNYFTFMQPFVEAAGFRLSTFSIPFLLGWFIIFVLEMFFSFFYMMFGVKFPHNFPNWKMECIAGGYYIHFNTAKSRLVLDYKPKYDPSQAKQTTIDWWRKSCKTCQ